MKSSTHDVIVVGGGAAGMMASIIAARRGARVLLLERNEFTGQKLRITGKGRCNLTNDCEPDVVIRNTPNGGKFLYSALNAFPPSETKAFFEKLGVPLKTERGARVFPRSDSAQDVVLALRRAMKIAGVEQRQARVSDITVSDGAVTGADAASRHYSAASVILCTGGASYPPTGSTGDGYEIARRLGHTIVEPKPSLVPLVEDGNTCSRMQGLSLKNVSVSVYDGGKKPIYTDFGELLFTHFGLSGPLTLSASAHMRDFACKKYTFVIDMKPALDEQKLDQRLLRDFEKYANRDFSNALDDLAPRLMIPVLVDLSGIPADQKVNSITREQRRALAALLKRFTISILGPRPLAEAIITSGGIERSEIYPKTMQSKLISGLYFAGEVIDVDAYTGGFNLQIAWSTAVCAGCSVCPELGGLLWKKEASR
ncbi:MAG: NAD(P)/FAD-dependent oxidoreductase [Oscillospiraceae bacterium]|nr:NAD(P)/FAD-dependent oxidoreductase [Oscillospiraceae bacterium]